MKLLPPGVVHALEPITPTKGSFRGSVFLLAGATLGAGTLSLPYAVAASGLAFAVVQLLVAALLTVYTIRLLIRASDIATLKSYEDLTVTCFGKRAAIFVEVNIFLVCFGIAVAYLVAIGDIITPLGQLYAGSGSVLAQRWVLISIVCGVITFPLSLIRDVGSLQFSSILGVFSIIFLVFAVCLRSLVYEHKHGIPKDVTWSIELSKGPNFMLSAPIIMFAFSDQTFVFSVYSELQRPCLRRMNMVVNRAIIISLSLYLAIGIIAYLAFGHDLVNPKFKGNILLSFSLQDTWIEVSRAAIVFTLATAFPLNIFQCRFTIHKMFFDGTTDPLWRHVLITIALVFVALLLAIFCPNINLVFGVIGGTSAAIVCFCLPAAFILKLEDGPLLGPNKRGPVLLLVGAFAIGFVGTGVTVWSSVIAK